MSPDLEALSREIAATSDAWMVPGADVISATGQFRLDNSDFVDGRFSWVAPHDSFRPNLADPVTVNSLLGTGEARWDATQTYWVATIGKGDAACPTRKHAICRAWIAANREKP